MTEIAEDKNRNGGPLKGVRITEFTSAWAGPYATCLLGFLGAEVIKVESKTYIDHSRYISFTTGKNFTTPNESSVFNTLNLNKKSVTLNLKAKKAIGLAKKLVKVSDAVIENMRPGVITRLGLGYDALKEVKEDLIYLSSSACGQTGPHKGYMGYAPTFASLAGLPHITGYEDWPPTTATAAAVMINGSVLPCPMRRSGRPSAGQWADRTLRRMQSLPPCLTGGSIRMSWMSSSANGPEIKQIIKPWRFFRTRVWLPPLP